MIICPVCQHQELEGTLFCEECGAVLPPLDTEGKPPKKPGFQRSTQDPPRAAHKKPGATRDFPDAAPDPAVPASSPFAGTPFGLFILPAGPFLPLIGSDEYTLGRVSSDQPILPDIDLTPYEAFPKGVSRLHATLHLEGDQLFITDLGSANGTRLNGRKLPPYKANRLADGDVIALGLIQMRVEVRLSDR